MVIAQASILPSHLYSLGAQGFGVGFGYAYIKDEVQLGGRAAAAAGIKTRSSSFANPAIHESDNDEDTKTNADWQA